MATEPVATDKVQKTRIESERFKSENSLLTITQKFQAKAEAGLVEAKDLNRLYNKAGNALISGEISEEVFDHYKNMILEENVSSRNLDHNMFMKTYQKRSVIRKELHDNDGQFVAKPHTQVMRMIESGDDITEAKKATPPVVNYVMVKDIIEKDQTLRLDHLPSAVTTLFNDLKNKAIEPKVAQTYANTLTQLGLRLRPGSEKDKILQQVMTSYTPHFEKRGVKLGLIPID